VSVDGRGNRLRLRDAQDGAVALHIQKEAVPLGYAAEIDPNRPQGIHCLHHARIHPPIPAAMFAHGRRFDEVTLAQRHTDEA